MDVVVMEAGPFRGEIGDSELCWWWLVESMMPPFWCCWAAAAAAAASWSLLKYLHEANRQNSTRHS